jgi:dTDP-4-dehydrorhamnose 3,5-epimerase
MIFHDTKLKGAYLIELERREDARGFNGRLWCGREFETQGVDFQVAQVNVLFNKEKGTLRGMHYQAAPYQESKVFRCVRGAIYDVIIDLRPGSPTYLQWVGVELRADEYKVLYVPKGCAQGFYTLEPNTELIYLVSQFYAPQAERGIRYDDPTFQVEWPGPPRIISDKDRSWPNFSIERETIIPS